MYNYIFSLFFFFGWYQLFFTNISSVFSPLFNIGLGYFNMCVHYEFLKKWKKLKMKNEKN